jgi:hypothetical protein
MGKRTPFQANYLLENTPLDGARITETGRSGHERILRAAVVLKWTELLLKSGCRRDDD